MFTLMDDLSNTWLAGFAMGAVIVGIVVWVGLVVFMGKAISLADARRAAADAEGDAILNREIERIITKAEER